MRNMKPAIFISCCILFAIMGCKRSMTRAELETNLITAMSNSLNKQVNFDTTKAKFEVQKVTFYEDKTEYDCEGNISGLPIYPGHLKY